MTLADRFEYETWSNRQWLGALAANGTEAEWAVFRHLLGLQKVFHLRVHGEAPSGVPLIEDPATELEELHEGWMRALFSHRQNPVFHYSRFDGERQALAFDDMVEHVLNHGAYHRGEIRGLYLARSCDQFPETDLLLFLREKVTPR